jgi:hypothetical protein
MGLGGLNFRVRDGNGCGPSGMATGKFFRETGETRKIAETCSGLVSRFSRVTRFSRCVSEDHVYQGQSIVFNVKPHGRLVLVSYGPYDPSTSSLSNS